jgi:hypothetical protein
MRQKLKLPPVEKTQDVGFEAFREAQMYTTTDDNL